MVAENMGSRQSRPSDQQPLFDDTDEELLIERISVVIMGQHGVGKNTLGNAILKKKAFTFQDRSKNYYLKDKNTTFGRHISVTRVPGWSADLNSERNREIWQVIKDSVRSVDDGPHVIILVNTLNTEPAKATKEKLKQLLGDNVLQHILIASVDADKIVAYHSDTKQAIVDRCKYHFFVRCTCEKQNRKLIETVEDFIVCKTDTRLYAMGNKAPNLKLQHQDLVNLVHGLKSKIAAVSDCEERKDAKIRELQRLLKEKEDMLKDKEEEIEKLKSRSSQNHTELSVLRQNIAHLTNELEQERKKNREYQRKIGKMEKKDEEQTKEIEKLRKENEALKSQNENQKRAKPSPQNGLGWMGTDSFELAPLTSEETPLDDEAPEASEDHIGVQFVKKYRKELIERIVAVQSIADDLHQFIGQHKYEMILQAPNDYEKKRRLFDIVGKSGKQLQIELYNCLLKHEEYLVKDLEESAENTRVNFKNRKVQFTKPTYNFNFMGKAPDRQ